MNAQIITIGVCVVTYQERFVQTPAFASLSELPAPLLERLRVVSVCNAVPLSSLEASHVSCSEKLVYEELQRQDNTGLAGGFNDGLSLVLQKGVTAILFLNADAVVERWYIEWLFEVLSKDAYDGFAPKLHSSNRQVSPFRKRGLQYNFYIIGYLCLRNSDFVRKLTFPSQFWLDGIDYWLSAELVRAGLVVEVHTRSIQHNLSVSDQFHTLPSWRYRNILISERTFLRSQHRPFSDLCILYGRALGRCLLFGRIDLVRVVAEEFMVALHD